MIFSLGSEIGTSMYVCVRACMLSSLQLIRNSATLTLFPTRITAIVCRYSKSHQRSFMFAVPHSCHKISIFSLFFTCILFFLLSLTPPPPHLHSRAVGCGFSKYVYVRIYALEIRLHVPTCRVDRNKKRKKKIFSLSASSSSKWINTDYVLAGIWYWHVFGPQHSLRQFLIRCCGIHLRKCDWRENKQELVGGWSQLIPIFKPFPSRYPSRSLSLDSERFKKNDNNSSTANKSMHAW